MKNKKAIFLLMGAIVLGLALFVVKDKKELSYLRPYEKQHQFVIEQGRTLFGFDLVDPEQAPPDIEKSVMRGHQLMMNTHQYASEYARDQLSCTNCHFMGGDTIGGRNNGISLVGVTTEYPQFSKRNGKVISLAERINNCFERSLNGRALPEDSQHMQDMLNYLKWISKEVEHLKDIPWLGLKPLKSHHQADPKRGEEIYRTQCALCHKEDGQGGAVIIASEGKMIPPIWGPNAFNDGAGMSQLSTLSSFIFWNMPYNNSVLTEEQAIDVASFVLQQPRSHFIER